MKPSKHGGAGRGQGRKPVDRADKANTLSLSITLTKDDLDFLRTINPDNMSAAIRSLIVKVREG